MDAARVILHVDMDAFYASVEQRDDPALRGKPVLVGHDGPRGVVTAASYEARVFGCHSAQPMAVAKRCCPQAIIVRGRFGAYREASEKVFTIFEQIAPLVEPLSIDEAFIDVTGSTRLLGPPRAIAEHIKQRVQDETGLTASVGVAPNKFLAKLASGWDKPDGLTMIDPDTVVETLAPLPIGRMWGVGPALEAKLRRLGIATFGDLQRMDREEAVRRLDSVGDHLWQLARGEDDRAVTSDGGAKSIGNEQTFERDVETPEIVHQVLLGQTEHVARRLRRHGLAGRTVTIKIRYGDFETVSRSTTLDEPTDRTDLLWEAALMLFERWRTAGFQPVRLIGVTASKLQAASIGQMALFPDGEADRRRRVDQATDAIEHRFGRAAIHRGLDLPDERPGGVWDRD